MTADDHLQNLPNTANPLKPTNTLDTMTYINKYVHVSAPFTGTAFEVLCAVFSGKQEHVDRAHRRPSSFLQLAPSSREKYIMFSQIPMYKDRIELQKNILAGKAPNRMTGNGENFNPQDRLKNSWRFLDEERVRKLFELGSIFTHVINCAGHAVLKRLTINDLEMLVPEGNYLRCSLDCKRFPCRIGHKDIAYDHEDFVVIDKPRSMPSIATRSNYVENAIYLTGEMLNCRLWSVVSNMNFTETQ